MSQITSIIKEILDQKYPQYQKIQSITLNSLPCQYLNNNIKSKLEIYNNLKTLSLTHCDLRNLQNFPRLYQLIDLDLSFNSLMGTFNFLMPLSKLQYLNLCSNLVSQPTKLLPLKKLRNLSICLKDNPLTNIDGFKNKIRSYQLQFLKQPKKLTTIESIDNKAAQCKLQEVKKINQKLQHQESHGSRELFFKEDSIQFNDKIQHSWIDEPAFFKRDMEQSMRARNIFSNLRPSAEDSHKNEQASSRSIKKTFNFNNIDLLQFDQMLPDQNMKYLSSEEIQMYDSDLNQKQLEEQDQQDMQNNQMQENNCLIRLVDYEDESQQEGDEQQQEEQEPDSQLSPPI